MKPSKCSSTRKKLFFAFGFISFCAIVLFLFPGCRNSSPAIVEGEVFVANMGAHSINVYARTNQGTLADTTIRVIRGSATGLHNPFDVAIDGLNRLWVANLGDPPATNPTITVYEPNANGNAAPSFTFTLNSTGLFGGTFMPGSLAKFGAETMIATSILTGGRSDTSQNVDPGFEIISATINGMTNTFGPTLSGVSAQLVNPTGIAFKTDTIFVAVSSLPMITGLYGMTTPPASAILLYGRTSSGFNSTTSVMISGSNTGLANPAHIKIDRSGNLFVLNRGIPGSPNSSPGISVFGPTQRGNVAPVRTIQGSNTGLVTSGVPYGIAVDNNGFIYVSMDNRILVFDANANGNVAPVHTLSNTNTSSNRNTDLSSPIGIAVK